MKKFCLEITDVYPEISLTKKFNNEIDKKWQPKYFVIIGFLKGFDQSCDDIFWIEHLKPILKYIHNFSAG